MKISSHQRRLWALLWLAALPLVGCTKTRIVKYNAVYYTASKRSTIQLELPDSNATSLDPSVKQTMKKGPVTVAFLPPSDCLQQAAGTNGGSALSQRQCNVLMSQLQNKAINRGFQLVSWDLLKKSKQPLTYAKQLNVNYLFEVNKFGVRNDALAKVVATKLRFTHLSRRRRRDLRVSSSLALRCKGYLERKRRLQLRRTTVALHINMIDVQSARYIWGYKKELGLRGQGRRVHFAQDTWLARRGGVAKRKARNNLATIGFTFVTLSVLGSAALFIASGAMGGDRKLDIIGLTVLGAGTGVGLLLGVIGLATFKPPKPKVPRVWSPASVMCRGPGLGMTRRTRKIVPRRPSAQSSYTFLDARKTPPKKQAGKKLDGVMQALINDFFARLK